MGRREDRARKKAEKLALKAAEPVNVPESDDKAEKPTYAPIEEHRATKPKVGLSGRFVTTTRVSHLLFESIEVTLKDGVVVDTKKLSRAPDMTAVAIGHASSRLWEISRDR